jgi:hypothetical protein
MFTSVDSTGNACQLHERGWRYRHITHLPASELAFYQTTRCESQIIGYPVNLWTFPDRPS